VKSRSTHYSRSAARKACCAWPTSTPPASKKPSRGQRDHGWPTALTVADKRRRSPISSRHATITDLRSGAAVTAPSRVFDSTLPRQETLYILTRSQSESARRIASMTVGICVLAAGMSGITEASITLIPS
jgi:hypothetical protein